jgi:hypothetical protein
MNTRTRIQKIRARFGIETRFDLAPVPVATFRAIQEAALEQFKHRLLQEWLAPSRTEFNPLLRRAANEAASLAWTTPYPLLFLPALLEEKATRAIERHERQIRVRKRSRLLFRGVPLVL